MKLQIVIRVLRKSTWYCGVAETSTRESKRHIQRVGELRFITPADSEDLTLQALSPEQRGYRVSIHRQAWLRGFAGLQGLGDCKEPDTGKWGKLQFLTLWVPTFWDLCDPDFARSKLNYRGRMSRRLCKILTFSLHLQLTQPLILQRGQVERGLESKFKMINNFFLEHSACLEHTKGRPIFWSFESMSKTSALRFL